MCKDRNALKIVKLRAARNVKNDHRQTSSVTQMLKDLDWESLADRRRDLGLILLYKIVNHFAAVTVDDILTPANPRGPYSCESPVQVQEHQSIYNNIQELILCVHGRLTWTHRRYGFSSTPLRGRYTDLRILCSG